jgi:hypothetical protein
VEAALAELLRLRFLLPELRAATQELLRVVVEAQALVAALRFQPFCTLRVLQAPTAPLVLQEHLLLAGPQLVMALAVEGRFVVRALRSQFGLAAMALAALFIWSGNL